MELHFSNLREALDVRQMTQAEMARALKWSEAKVSRLLRGKTGDVTLTQINQLARLLETSPAHLVTLDDVAQNDTERELLRNFRCADMRDREIVRLQLMPRHST